MDNSVANRMEFKRGSVKPFDIKIVSIVIVKDCLHDAKNLFCALHSYRAVCLFAYNHCVRR